MLLRALFLLVCTLFIHPQDGPDASLLLLIEDEQIVIEVTCNLAFLDEVIDVAREDEELVDAVEMPGIRAALIDYFADISRVTIDGIHVSGAPGEMHLTLPKRDLLPLFPGFGARALTQLTLSFTYSTKSPPDRVVFHWSSFPPDRIQDEGRGDNLLNVAGLLIAYGQDTNLEFTTLEPEYSWQRPRDGVGPRFEAVPILKVNSQQGSFSGSSSINLLAVSALLLGAFIEIRRRVKKKPGTIWVPILFLVGLGSLTLDSAFSISTPEFRDTLETGRVEQAESSDQRALTVFQPLHANIYRAFDYTKESDIYDALEQSVEGDLLNEIYAQVYQGLVMREEGGAVSRVQAVIPVSFQIVANQIDDATNPRFDVDARWRVEGAVHHWGHAHTRLNEYRAYYTVVGRFSADGKRIDQWRIQKSTTLEQFRVASEPIPETL
ncbi:MAG: hypothetical protein HOM77_08175 [Planctomycetes bacterium]|nr:hypothetical protein [Planctomycetota bacterium]